MSSPSASRDLIREWTEQKATPHPSVDGKYDMLVLRDKIVRANRKFSGTDNLEVAEDDLVIIGVCPEMCPEKERYERIKQGRVDSFEKQTRMIKDFSRQAADQDMPLPTELRTPAALRTTMDFLLREIIAEPPANPESPSGWYDFVWRRVRAIRKEVTQQRLTGPAIAGILEDMCRFHIVAFHMFCEADQNQFAPKLNLENLNDCLASLERIYAGMATEGQYSPNVAEFRAYEMILRVWTDKLDLVKTTAQLDQLPVAVRHSPQLAFARRVISAVNNRFFSEYLQLMTTADYVTACLMHYYLPMVQAKALDFLATASGSRSKTANTKVSSHFFAKMFCLATDEDLVRFTSYHGLLYEPGTALVFFPMGFAKSRDPKMYPRTRSRLLIEPKTAGRNLAEIVAKRQFAEIPVPDVVQIDSFDQRGFYVGQNPFTVSFEKENIGPGNSHANLFQKDFSAKNSFPDAKNVTGNLPSLSVPRSFIPSPKPVYSSSSLRLPTPDFALSAGHSPRFSSPAISSPGLMNSSPDRKRSRASSLNDDDDEATGPSELKRLHQDTPRTPSPVKVAPPVFNQMLPASPGPSPKSKYSPEKFASYLEEEASEEVEKGKEYPLRTHLQVIRARTVCQAGAPLGCVFKAWWAHATRHRRPSRFFGQVDASAEQRQKAERLRLEEIQRLTWMKYPFRSTLLAGDAFDVCTMLFLYAAEENFCQMEQWLRTKLGDPEPCAPNPIRIVTYKQDHRMLRIIFVRLFDEDSKIVNDVAREIEPVGLEISAIILYALDRYSLATAKDLLSRSNIRADIPVALFCHDDAVNRFDMESDLNGNLILDIFVPQIGPSMELSGILWESILTVTERRLPMPVQKNTTLLRLVTELYCNYLRMYRTLKVEVGPDVVERQAAIIWNSLVEDYLAGESVEISVDTERTSDRLLEILQSNQLCPFLKVDESSLWETPGRFPEVFPIGSANELSDFDQSSYEVWAAISEKVLTVSAMATVCDPVVWQNPKFLPDFELQLRDWLEKLEDDRSENGRRSSSSCTNSDTRSDGEDHQLEDSGSGAFSAETEKYPPKTQKIGTELWHLVRQDAQRLTKWFDKISSDFAKLDSL